MLFGAGTAVAVEHVYRVQVKADLSELLIQAQLADNVEVLISRDGDAGSLRNPRGCDARPLPVEGNRLVVRRAAGCVQYQYPLTNEKGRAPAPAHGVVVSAPREWLWLPRGGDSISVEFVLPRGVEVSTPWRAVGDNVYALTASPESSRAAVVFGNFRSRILSVPGANLRVALVDSPDLKLDQNKTLTWLGTAAADVAAVSGQFPNPAPQVVVQPARGGRSAVPFGFVIRDGGEAVRFFLDPDRGLDEYLGDWTATHEFAHLLLPYVDPNQKWISEGFASYYQNVLLARRGVYSEKQAWQRLHRSFTRAAEVKNPPTLDNITNRPFWEVRMLIYWSGAAIALLADVRLRELSDGRESLDTVLGRLQECCLPSGETWEGERLFRKLDELSPHRVFVDLYGQHAQTRGMPDLEPLYKALGLRFAGKAVTFDAAARLAAIRHAIMSDNERATMPRSSD